MILGLGNTEPELQILTERIIESETFYPECENYICPHKTQIEESKWVSTMNKAKLGTVVIT